MAGFNATDFLAKHNGNAEEALSELGSENLGYREKNRNLKSQLLELEGKIEDYASLGDFKEVKKRIAHLGNIEAAVKASFPNVEDLAKAISEIPEKLSTSSKLAEQLVTERQERLSDKLVNSKGWKKSVFGRLANDDKIELEEKGDEILAKIDGKEIDLEKHVTEKWADYLPSLQDVKTVNGQQTKKAPIYGSEAGKSTGKELSRDEVIAKAVKEKSINPIYRVI